MTNPATPERHDAFSIDAFCDRHFLHKNTLFRLWREGRGPRRMQIGRRVLISAEAAAEWRREVEAFPVPTWAAAPDDAAKERIARAIRRQK
jgi:hypothetical protein